MKHLAVHGLYRAGSTNERLSLADVADEVNGATINTDVRFDKHLAGSKCEELRVFSAKINLAGGLKSAGFQTGAAASETFLFGRHISSFVADDCRLTAAASGSSRLRRLLRHEGKAMTKRLFSAWRNFVFEE